MYVCLFICFFGGGGWNHRGGASEASRATLTGGIDGSLRCTVTYMWCASSPWANCLTCMWKCSGEEKLNSAVVTVHIYREAYMFFNILVVQSLFGGVGGGVSS